MVGTIVPIGYGERAQGQRALTPWIHFLGNVLGGAAVGALLGALGAVLLSHGTVGPGSALLVTGVAGLVYSLRELGIVPVPLPLVRRQVPSKWRRDWPPRVAAFFYGLALGGGVSTSVYVSTFYVVAVWVVLQGSPVYGAIVLGLFGAGRGLPIAALGTRPWSVKRAFDFTLSLDKWREVMALVNGVALALSGSLLVAMRLALR